GYYDRLLRDADTRPFLVALAFEVQIVNKIPIGDHDVRMDKIITEKRIIDCK
ncbi:MAG TPA: 5-formyltetrahydrofolate cyclo-ligase, partial [Nitrospiraceae bacterium]|nr:5-formyltetrahydrofolate cyclo-ligase [Nitrospiraceae bacterium]